ncbi:MAG: sugar phosphate isomerase/epimerase and 4-hydroxyphenylpyruvate domain-containing protein [Reyranella sp.]|uniref:bifunctional sugar phosphate isomerase/epimerase/4-hydroxyphenylpyruvate dioxygenase family protein n=1 Tax=Reyranella sp. TaxID=1929291 RepID=UPI001ACF87A3|nr:sugar phosphate isomerase/epimerase and 4-hydroxyphenylpyruvate domain-containing protein [Reyranella sp.]MBN9087019.1 sugar phosphate isomerase/epimerase and 4-hydroxyphenylpyruvate domain-containing protein [Reyranella sp.]
MKTSIATVSLSGTLGEKLDAIAAAKFDAVEIFENDLVTFNGTPADGRNACRELGLDIVTLQPFRDFEGMPAGQRERAFARAERKFDTMQELGTDLLMICSNVSPESLGGIDRAAADLRELGERAARRGLRIAFEALAWGRHINDYRDAWEAVRRADHPAVGLVLDSFHILARGTDLSTIRSIPGDRIFLVQLADAPRLQMDYLSWSRHFRNFPGQGELPVLDFMRALQSTSYDDALSLEIFNDQFRAGSAHSVAIDGHRSLRFMMDQLGTSTLALPPRARAEGVSFIEFSADDQDAPRLEALLAGLGFRRAGQHRSKQVTRWTQGDINLVVNREKEGFAHSFNLVHGSAVCALGLAVGNAAQTFERATLLLDQPFHQAVGPGELDIPSVRGVGGSLIYFLDEASDLGRVWEIEFAPTGDTGNEAGLTRVDHISQSMQYDEMLSWLLFYTSLLDLDKVPPQEVADPGGLVRSQVIEAADGRVRFVLNASQSQRTQSSRFLSELFGSGVQHIALATHDLMATIAQLEKNGVRLLPIPENYYDDLEAKTDLSPDRLMALRAHNILYDREGDAEYLQVYTETFDQRFFFEIVQRIGYRGYGAVNAPVRLAAQARLSSPLPR